MKNATRRNSILAAVAALTLAAAPSALADVRIHVSLPLPPPPHKVLRHLPPLPPPPVVDFGYRPGYDGRWNYENRHRDDHYVRRYGKHGHGRAVWVEGSWVVPPYPGAVWVSGYTDRYGYWVSGYWARYR